MRYIYILVSNSKDTYYEQFLLSITSLRYILPNSEILLLSDAKTIETLTGTRTEFRKLVSEVITIDTPSTLNQKEVSRWIKTSVRRFVKGDFLFIDCDTIITGDISTISNMGIIFGACLDKHSTLDKHHMKDYIKANEKKLGFSSCSFNRHINSGVIYCTDTPETYKLFDRWHELWLFTNSKNITVDQPSFNQAINENLSIFTELEGNWNCQITFNGLPFLSEAKIIHYYASSLITQTSPYILASEPVFDKIKSTGIITDETFELIKNPKTAFNSETRIIAGKENLDVINSNLFAKFLWMRTQKPRLFSFLNKFSSLFKNPKYNRNKKGQRNNYL